MTKKGVQEETGNCVTKESTMNWIWSSIKGILNSDHLTKNSLKIQIDDQLIQDPIEVVEHYKVFFKEKVEKLASGLNNNSKSDTFSRLNLKCMNVWIKVFFSL